MQTTCLRVRCSDDEKPELGRSETIHLWVIKIADVLDTGSVIQGAAQGRLARLRGSIQHIELRAGRLTK